MEEIFSCFSFKPSPSLSQRERSLRPPCWHAVYCVDRLARREAYLYNLPLARLRPIFIRPGADFTLAHAGSAGDCRTARHVALVQRLGCSAGADEGMESQRSSGKLAHALGPTWFRSGHSFECAGKSSRHHQSPSSFCTNRDRGRSGERRIRIVCA